MFDVSKGDQYHLNAPVIGKKHFRFFKIHSGDVPDDTTRWPFVVNSRFRKLLKAMDLRISKWSEFRFDSSILWLLSTTDTSGWGEELKVGEYPRWIIPHSISEAAPTTIPTKANESPTCRRFSPTSISFRWRQNC